MGISSLGLSRARGDSSSRGVHTSRCSRLWFQSGTQHPAPQHQSPGMVELGRGLSLPVLLYLTAVPVLHSERRLVGPGLCVSRRWREQGRSLRES